MNPALTVAAVFLVAAVLLPPVAMIWFGLTRKARS